MDDWCNTFLALICQIAHSKPSSNPFPDKCFSNTGHPVIYQPISIVFCQTYAHRISSCNLIVFCQTSALRISSRNLPSYFIMVSILGFGGLLINGFWIGYLLQWWHGGGTKSSVRSVTNWENSEREIKVKKFYKRLKPAQRWPIKHERREVIGMTLKKSATLLFTSSSHCVDF